MTVWALLGSYNWNLLLTGPDGEYEPGAFDVRAPAPRPTAIADLVHRLAAGEPPPEAARGLGWWQRDIRLRHTPVFRTPEASEPSAALRTLWPSTRPILITGATGTLGRAFARACEWRGLDYVLTGRERLSLEDSAGMRRVLEELNPWLVINAAGFVRVDDAEREATACMAANAAGAIDLATACQARQRPFVTFSSDLVFGGDLSRPYIESDAPRPLNVYGESKRQAENAILDLGGHSLVVRTSAFFSAFDPHNFAAHIRRLRAEGRPVEAADDLYMSPTYVPDLVDATLDLAIDGERGVWHLANVGAVSWAEFARMILKGVGENPRSVTGCPAEVFGWAAPRPKRVPLASERGWIMPTLDFAIARYAADLQSL